MWSLLEIPKNQIRLVVGFQLAIEFHECVAMELKHWSHEDSLVESSSWSFNMILCNLCHWIKKERGYHRE